MEEPLMTRVQMPPLARVDSMPVLDSSPSSSTAQLDAFRKPNFPNYLDNSSSPTQDAASYLDDASPRAQDSVNGVEERLQGSAVSNDMESYLFPSLSGEMYYGAITFALRLTAEAGLPNLDVSLLDGRFLQIQCMMVGATHILEVGTMGGVSSIWLASSSPLVKLLSVYTDPRRKKIADQALARAGLKDRIEIVNGEGAEVLPVLRMYVLDGHREKFGMVYIHGESEHRESYLDKVIPMCKENAVIIVDNVVWTTGATSGGRVQSGVDVDRSRSLMETVGNDPRIRPTFVPTVGGQERGEGFLMCIVKRPEVP